MPVDDGHVAPKAQGARLTGWFTAWSARRAWTLLLGSLLVGLLAVEQGFAQAFVYDVVYRPPGTRYRVLERPHFEIIFEAGAEAEAREAGDLLEASLPDVRTLLGARHRFRMPVVLNRFNDRSNGYVTPLPFKQEIEVISIKGTTLSPRFRSWMQTVAPHELVHAVHADFQEGFGVGEVVRWFAPDLARSMNLAVPSGIAEGAAVLYESRLEGGNAGRLNHALFTMEFRAALASGRPWSLAQMLERPAYSFPFDRFYNGGGHLFKYLNASGKTDFFARASKFQYRFPLLGYGVSLWYGTRTWPRSLRRQFQETMLAEEAKRREALGPLSAPRVVAGARGVEHHRPRWLDPGTLLVYAFGYNVTPGLYRVDLETGSRTLLSVQGLTEDRFFSLEADGGGVLFARYVPDPFVSRRWIAELFRMDLDSRSVERLTRGGRVMAPVRAPDGGVWALRNEGQYNQWVQVEGTTLRPMTNWTRARFVEVRPAPDGRTAAVVVNIRGYQGLFRAEIRGGEVVGLAPWVGFTDASIYDAAWGPAGETLVFTADRGGIANIYLLDVRTGEVRQLTNALYGAMEPAISPDGRLLAYITYEHERYDLAVLPLTPGMGTPVPREETRRFASLPWAEWVRPEPSPTASPEPTRPYHSLQALRPRMVFPTLRLDHGSTGPGGTRLGTGIGLGIQGTDPLQQWSVAAEGFWQKNQFWGGLAVRTAAHILRPSLRLFRTPGTVLVRFVDADGRVSEPVRVGRESRGIEGGVSLPVTLEANVYRSSLAFFLQGEYRQERLFDRDGKHLNTFTGRVTLNPAVSFGYRLQRNLRDLTPNRGLVMTYAAELDVAADEGTRRAAHIGQAHLFVPWLLRYNTGLRLHASVLRQNQGSIFNLDRFMPRGYEDAFLGKGTYYRFGAEVTQPLWFIDNGLVILPVYIKALYTIGFAETLRDFDGGGVRLSSLGAGLGIQLRLFYLVDLDLRLSYAYRVEEGRWTTVYR